MAGAAASHRVLVTDGDQRSALAVVRSLGRAGYELFVCSEKVPCLASASRWSGQAATVPSALDEPNEFVTALLGLVRRWKIDVLIPVAEPAVIAVLEARSRFDGVAIPFPLLSQFMHISDKQDVLRTAQSLGIGVPRQVTVADRRQFSSVLDQDLQPPLVIKPARSVGEAHGHRTKVGVLYASDTADAVSRVEHLTDASFPLLVQQRIVGPGVGVFLLIWNGEVRAVFGHRRIREKPPTGGVSVYRESIALDDRLIQQSISLLEHYSWQGVAMVEYKIDAVTGVPYLMEVNGRFWGSLQLAVDAGVDFPVLLVRSALGEKTHQTTYRTGIRSRWWWGDIDQLLSQLRPRNEYRFLHPGESRLRAVANFLVFWRREDRSEVFRWRDPQPFLRETVEWIRDVWR